MSTNDQELKTLYPEGKTITVKGEAFTIKPFVLRNRIKVLTVVAAVFTEVYGGATPEQVRNPNGMMLQFISAAGERLIDIYEIVLGKDKEWLGDIQLSDEIEIIKAVIEVNDFPFLISQVQSLMRLKIK